MKNPLSHLNPRLAEAMPDVCFDFDRLSRYQRMLTDPYGTYCLFMFRYTESVGQGQELPPVSRQDFTAASHDICPRDFLLAMIYLHEGPNRVAGLWRDDKLPLALHRLMFSLDLSFWEHFHQQVVSSPF